MDFSHSIERVCPACPSRAWLEKCLRFNSYNFSRVIFGWVVLAQRLCLCSKPSRPRFGITTTEFSSEKISDVAVVIDSKDSAIKLDKSIESSQFRTRSYKTFFSFNWSYAGTPTNQEGLKRPGNDSDWLKFQRSFNGVCKSFKMRRLATRWASSRLVANKHFIEIMTSQSSNIYGKKINCWFEPIDGATSGCHNKSWRNLIFSFKKDLKALYDACKYFT